MLPNNYTDQENVHAARSERRALQGATGKSLVDEPRRYRPNKAFQPGFWRVCCGPSATGSSIRTLPPGRAARKVRSSVLVHVTITGRILRHQDIGMPEVVESRRCPTTTLRIHHIWSPEQSPPAERIVGIPQGSDKLAMPYRLVGGHPVNPVHREFEIARVGENGSGNRHTATSIRLPSADHGPGQQLLVIDRRNDNQGNHSSWAPKRSLKSSSRRSSSGTSRDEACGFRHTFPPISPEHRAVPSSLMLMKMPSGRLPRTSTATAPSGMRYTKHMTEVTDRRSQRMRRASLTKEAEGSGIPNSAAASGRSESCSSRS